MLVYEPTLQFRTFILVGCGGTGSRIASMLSQFVASTCNHPTIKPLIVFVDDDIVEPKNLARQLFSSADVGEYKAEALARRYSSAFNIPIVPVIARAKSPVLHVGESIRDIIIQTLCHRNVASDVVVARRMLEKPTILITAVDSVDARRDIIAGWCADSANGSTGATMPMDHLASTVIIDPGNAAITGQVSVFNPVLWPCNQSSIDWARTLYTREGHVNNDSNPLDLDNVVTLLPERLGAEQRVTTIPMPWMRYLKSKGSVNAPSCADLDQTLAVNSLVATASFTIVQNLIFGVPLRSLTAYFSVDLDNHTKKMTYPWLKEVLTGKDKEYFTVDAYVEWTTAVLEKVKEHNESDTRILRGYLSNLITVVQHRSDDPAGTVSRVVAGLNGMDWKSTGVEDIMTKGQLSMLAYPPRRLQPTHLFWPKQDTAGRVPGSLRGFLNTGSDSYSRPYLYRYISTGKWEEEVVEPVAVHALVPEANTEEEPSVDSIDPSDGLLAEGEGVPLEESTGSEGGAPVAEATAEPASDIDTLFALSA